jgi:signal transduction histidine kinase
LTNTTLTGDFAGIVSARIGAERFTLASYWLARLKELLTVEANDVFPSDQLLDHIPSLIGEIAAYLCAPEEEEIAANAAVIDKARELGRLRHGQHASVHQLLREYEILQELLETFVVKETERLALTPTASECFEVLRRLTRSARTLMRTTVDTFVAEYTSAIQERNDRLGAFNQMASHELRSPIGTLMFAAAALEMDHVRADPRRLDKVVTTIHTNVERLSWLITNLQRLARLGEPLDVPSQQRFDVHGLAIEVVRQLEDMAAARTVALRVAPCDIPPLTGDPARLELVLLNLVSNAIKYSDPDKPDRFVDVSAAIDGRGSCSIVVRDNGLGIAESDQQAVFDRFVRVHSHLDREHGVAGTGLGLAIVADCLKALGGSVRCESILGEGTAFVVTVPYGDVIEAQASRTARSSTD